MTFERSPEGVANRVLFYRDVDYIAYHEGCEPSEDCADRLYWEALISHLQPDLRIEYLATGSKLDIIEVHRRALESSHERTICLLDRDLDDQAGILIEHDLVFYTYGYSFENDLISEETLVSACHSLTASRHAVRAASAAWKEVFAKQESKLNRIAVFEQAVLKLCGRGLAHYNLYRLSEFVAGKEIPHISIKKVLHAVKAEKMELGPNRDRVLGATEPNWQKRLQGHFVADLVYHAFWAAIYQVGIRTKFSKKAFQASMIAAAFPLSGCGLSALTLRYYTDSFSVLGS